MTKQINQVKVTLVMEVFVDVVEGESIDAAIDSLAYTIVTTGCESKVADAEIIDYKVQPE